MEVSPLQVQLAGGARRGASARPGISPAAREREASGSWSGRLGLGVGFPRLLESPGLGVIPKRLKPFSGASSEVLSAVLASRVRRCVSVSRDSFDPGVGRWHRGPHVALRGTERCFPLLPGAENGIGRP